MVDLCCLLFGVVRLMLFVVLLLCCCLLMRCRCLLAWLIVDVRWCWLLLSCDVVVDASCLL